MCHSLGSEHGVVPEQGVQGLWPSPPVSLSETGRCRVGQALSPPTDPLYDWDSQGAHLPQT